MKISIIFTDHKEFEVVTIVHIVSQSCGWKIYIFYWAMQREDALIRIGIQRWPHTNNEDYWTISNNLSHGLYNVDVLDCHYIMKNRRALIN